MSDVDLKDAYGNSVSSSSSTAVEADPDFVLARV